MVTMIFYFIFTTSQSWRRRQFLGLVYRVSDSSDVSVLYAVKLERTSKKRLRPPSEHEANVMRLLANPRAHPCIPRVIEYGYDKQRHSKALVLDLLGEDLQILRAKCGNRFSIKTTLLLALRLVCFLCVLLRILADPILFLDSYHQARTHEGLCTQRHKAREHALRSERTWNWECHPSNRIWHC